MNEVLAILTPVVSSAIGVGLYSWGYSRGRKKAEELHKLYAPGERLTITLPPQQGMTTKPKTVTVKGGRWNA